MKIVEYSSSSEKQTQKLAHAFARTFVRMPPSPRGAVVIALKGKLGSGKTTFVKGFARGLGIKRIIQSPTFVLVKSYPLLTTHYKFFYHIDVYRLRSGRDLKMLGWNEWIKNPKNIICVEWAERVSKILPKHRIEIRFKHISQNKRKLGLYVS